MTTTFTASNGDTVETRHDGYLVVKDSHHTEWVSPLTVDTLREYFTAERDEQLGRWRSKEHPNYVVYPVEGKTREVRVSNEATGVTRSFCDHPDYLEANSQIRTLVAREYFAAHPEPKPWHNAKPGEVWVLETELHPEPRAFKVSSREGYATSNFTQVYNGQPLYTFRDGPITAGRRIWPEESDDE